MRRRGLIGGGALGLMCVLRAGGGRAQPAADGSVMAPVRLEDGRVSVEVHLSGRGPFRFIIDTGAYVSCIDDDLAARVPELVVEQNVSTTGIGGARIGRLYRAPDVVIGGSVHQRDVVFAGLAQPVGGGEGLLAAGLLTTYDTDLDLQSQVLRIWPHGRPAREGWTALDTEFTGGQRRSSPKIVVRAELDGRPARFTVDTGAPGPLLLWGRTARDRGYWRSDRPFAPRNSAGLHGREPRPDRVVRASSFKLGPLEMERPLITLHNPDDATAFDTDGLVGLATLQRLNLSFDSRAKRLWVRANGRPAPPERYPLSGVWFDPDGRGRARVAEVSPGSPAAEAGLERGETVTSPATFAETLRAVSARAGSEVRLTTDRREAVLRLRAFL